MSSLRRWLCAHGWHRWDYDAVTVCRSDFARMVVPTPMCMRCGAMDEEGLALIAALPHGAWGLSMNRRVA